MKNNGEGVTKEEFEMTLLNFHLFIQLSDLEEKITRC